jgi:D-alanyl-D-alanine carboxypeptidase/D-alanyl-D-alanine-endopeptidase (penicillin-binding protein 4)
VSRAVGPTSRRHLPVALLVTALLTALAALVVVVLWPGPSGPGGAPTASSPASPAPSPTGPPERSRLLEDLPGSAPAPSEPGLAALVTAAQADPALGGRLAVSVLDAATGEPLLERDARTALLPASTAKIVTAVAALTALDPGDRLTTRVLAGPAPGEVVLVGAGDPTLAAPRPADASGTSYPPPAQLTDLAAQVRSALGGAALTRVLVDESLYEGERLGPGWRPTYVAQGAVAPVVPLMLDGGRVRPDRPARHAEPGLAAGAALGAQLSPGAPVPVVRGSAPAGAAELGAVSSPTVAELVERMLLRSDNDLSEALARQVALRTGRPASFAGAADAVREVLGPYLSAVGVAPDSVALVDGSGLSRLNALQPAAVSRLLARVAADDGSADVERLAPVLRGLPVGGFSGTLADRYREAGGARPAAGLLRAKTGTLEGVSALAGVVPTADGRLLAFHLAADGVPPGANRRAEVALDALAGALARCGCR